VSSLISAFLHSSAHVDCLVALLLMFALRSKDITPFHSEEPNGAILSSAKEKIQSKLVHNSRIFNQNWSKTAEFGCCGPVLIELSARNHPRSWMCKPYSTDRLLYLVDYVHHSFHLDLFTTHFTCYPAFCILGRLAFTSVLSGAPSLQIIGWWFRWLAWSVSLLIAAL
jgi:hypothetical protein